MCTVSSAWDAVLLNSENVVLCVGPKCGSGSSQRVSSPDGKQKMKLEDD